MSECEDEIESLNSNLDAKNEFIVALQAEVQDKNKETSFLLSQLDKSKEAIIAMEVQQVS